jgi:phosphatidate cytidylyltransferase
MNKNLAIRTAVAAVAIPIILWICYQGGLWLLGLISLFFLVALSEFLIAEKTAPTSIGFWGIMIIGALHMAQVGAPEIGSTLSGESGKTTFESIARFSPLLVLLLVAGVVFATGNKPPVELFGEYVRLMWGIAYLFMLYPFVIYIGRAVPGEGRLSPLGGDWLLFLFGLLWLGDSAAMFVGKAIGKHKLAPTVSPNKTVEGFVGGIAGAMVVAIILGYWRLDMIPMWQLIIIAMLCSIFGQLGDLVESMWKRSLGIKDSSAIIPGHGGVLDRFDSLLFAAPVMYYAMLLIGK